MTSRPGRSLQFVAVLLPVLAYSLFRFSVGPLLPSIQDNFSISVAVSGSLVSASTAAVGIGTAISGYMVSRLDERKTVFVGMFIFSVPLGASVFIRSFLLFAPLFVTSGLGGGLMTAPVYPIAAAMVPKRKGAVTGLVGASYNLGGLVGPTVSGVLLNYLGWQYPFLVIGIVGIVFALIFQASLTGFETPRPDSSLTFLKDLKKLILNRNILVVAIAMMLADFSFFAYVTYTIQYFGNRFSLSPSALVPIDFYFGVAVGLGALGVIAMGLLYDWVGAKTTCVIDGTALTILTFALYTVTGLAVAIVVMFAVGFFVNAFYGILSIVAQANAPDYSRASAVSFVQTAAFVGAVLGLVIAAVLFGNTVTAVPLLLTVTVPYAVFTVIVLALYSTAQTQTLNK